MEVLGPLVVSAGGTRLRLGPALRALLLCLLCAKGDLVPAGRLVDLLSEKGSPAGSTVTLRSHISHLRRAIHDGAGQIRGHPGSVIVTDRVGGGTAYALRLDVVRVDSSRFLRDVALGIKELQAGDADRAAGTLRAALRLWRGQPLADVAGSPFAQPEIRRLEAAYRGALVARVQADARSGLDGSVIGELESLVERWPDDEALRVLHVTCLYDSGRMAEAARACRAAIEFAVERGLESRRLTVLQREVLTGTLRTTGVTSVP